MKRKNVIKLVLFTTSLFLIGVNIYLFTMKDPLVVQENTELDILPEMSVAQKRIDPNAPTGGVVYQNNSFNPPLIKFKVQGSVKILFTNSSNDTIDIESDPHPQHSSSKELNIGKLAPNAAKIVTLKSPGIYSYHNHLNPSEKGRFEIAE